jgi:cytochrome P450
MFTPYLLATDPELLKQMFIKDFRKFRNNDFTVSENEKFTFLCLQSEMILIRENAFYFQVSHKDPIIARNPFWMKDDAWKEKRNEVIPAMTAVKLKAMYPLIIDGTKNFVAYINREIERESGKAFDSRDICARYTCDSICSCTFGTEAQSFTSDDPFFYEKGRQMLRGMADSLQSYLPKKMLPDEVEKFFIEIAKEAIKCRTENKIKQDDFLTHTIAIKDKKGMSDIDAAAHCVTLFLDGYETTSVTLHHALHELGKNKQIQEKLRNEINENIDGDFLSYDKLLELPYLNQIFYETLRMHPPLLLTTRVCSEDVEVKGFKGHTITMKKDSSIWIPIPSIQRDPGSVCFAFDFPKF